MVKLPKFKSKVFLAPMADITNIAFRLMCKKYGAGLVSTELLSANAISRKNNAVMKLSITDKKEKPNVIQLFGQKSENMAKSAKIMEKEFDIIDLNFGCPSLKIMAQGSGGALMKRPLKIGEIVKEVREAVKKPISAKIRKGFDKKINGVEVAKICEENGADIIIIHGRTIGQGYSGKADWEIIKKVKQSVKIPVVGNGDIKDGESAKKMFKETGCDYIMIGRSAIGNPFIFKEVNEYLKSGKIIKQTKKDKIKDYFEYIELTKKFKIFSILDAKRQAQYFTKGFEGSAKLRKKLNGVRDFEIIKKIIEDF